MEVTSDVSRSLLRFVGATRSAIRANGVTMDRTSAAYFGDRLRMTATWQGKNMLMPDSGDRVSGDGVLGARDMLYDIPGAARTTRS